MAAAFYPGRAAVCFGGFGRLRTSGSVVSARITPLRLEAFEQLPKHARRCVFWEVDPSTLGSEDHLSDPEFEKEAWLSMVMLEWGSCGQLAVDCADGGRSATRLSEPDDEPCLGYAFYAPPRCRAAGAAFPTGPVSADAVLLTSLGVEAGQGGARSAGGRLIAAVVGDLVRRGVRALEAFGRTAEVSELSDRDESCLRNSGRSWRCSVTARSISASSTPICCSTSGSWWFAAHVLPAAAARAREGLGWKADVEAALERLLESAQLQQPVGAGAGPCS